MNERNAIHPDIPTERAWKAGRRIYVVAGYKSQLNTELRNIGAKWDGDERALWVGSAKLDQVLPLMHAHAERVQATEAVKEAGRWVAIPYDAADIRAAAKKLGGRWDAQRKEWALPTDEAQAEIQQAVADWQGKRRAAKAEAKRAASRSPEQVIADSGRAATGETGAATGQLHGRMRRPQAEQAGPQVGEIRRLANGQRVLVLSSRVEFWGQDAVDDLAPHEEPGWRYEYRYAVVEPTTADLEQEARARASADDEAEIAAVMEAAAQQRQSVRALARVSGSTITCSGSSNHDGRITLTEDGRAIYQHPGYYDMYIETEAQLDAPLTERVKQLIAGGARTRGRFEVRP